MVFPAPKTKLFLQEVVLHNLHMQILIPLKCFPNYSLKYEYSIYHNLTKILTKIRQEIKDWEAG